MGMAPGNMIGRENKQTTYRCEGCGYTHAVPAQFAGKLGKCPSCGKANRIGGGNGHAASAGAKAPVRPGAQEGTYIPSAEVAKKRCPHCNKVIEDEASGTIPVELLSPQLDKPHQETVAVKAPPAQQSQTPDKPRQNSAVASASSPSPAPQKPAQGNSAGAGPSNSSSEPYKPTQQADRKTHCPYCREEILASARKCKHCHEYLDETAKFFAKQDAVGGSRPKAQPVMNPSGPGDNKKLLIICGSLVVVAVIGFLCFHSFGGKATPGSPAASAGRGGESDGGKGDAAKPAGNKPAVSSSALDGLLVSLKKELQDGQTKDQASNSVFFLPSDNDEHWAAEVQGTSGIIKIPYRLDAANPRKASSRGLLFLALKSQGTWALETLRMESHVDIVGGKENPVDVGDRVKALIAAKDRLFQSLDAAVKKVQTSGD